MIAGDRPLNEQLADAISVVRTRKIYTKPLPLAMTAAGRRRMYKVRHKRIYRQAQSLKTERQSRNGRKQLKEYVYNDKLEKGCANCPERRPNVLQYHHVNREDKLFDIYTGSKAGVSLQVLKDEIAKCIVLCANCHIVKERGDGYR